jgi:hypothetical protein
LTRRTTGAWQEDRDVQETEQKNNIAAAEKVDRFADAADAVFAANARLWAKVKKFFGNNPTLVLTLLYLYASASGLRYSAGLYGRFGINIFDYSEVGDFLLIAFKNPLFIPDLVQVVVLTLGVWATFKIALLVERYRRPVDEFLQRLQRTIALTILGLSWGAVIIIFIFIPVQVTYIAGSKTAAFIKKGGTPAVEVRYRTSSGSAEEMTKRSLALIGATQRAAFFYDVDDKRTIVIPQSQLVSIEVPEPD